jgi:hypothetical protein
VILLHDAVVLTVCPHCGRTAEPGVMVFALYPQRPGMPADGHVMMRALPWCADVDGCVAQARAMARLAVQLGIND